MIYIFIYINILNCLNKMSSFCQCWNTFLIFNYKVQMRVWYFFGFCCCCISLLKLIGWSYQQKMTPGATGMKWKHILSGILRCVNLSVRYITNKCQKYFSYFVWRFIINIQVIPLAQLDGCVIHLICGRGTCVSNGNTHLRTRPITNTWLETPRISLRVWRCSRISQRKKRLFLQSEDSLGCEKPGSSHGTAKPSWEWRAKTKAGDGRWLVRETKQGSLRARGHRLTPGLPFTTGELEMPVESGEN